MFHPRLSVSPFKKPARGMASTPVLAIIALITIGGSMCFVAGGLFLFSAISLHQSETYCSGFLILFVGIVLLATCYLAWVLTSRQLASPDVPIETISEVTATNELQYYPPSYDDAVKDM